MDGGDGSRRCDDNSSSTDGLNQPSVEGAHAMFTGKMLHTRIVRGTKEYRYGSCRALMDCSIVLCHGTYTWPIPARNQHVF